MYDVSFISYSCSSTIFAQFFTFVSAAEWLFYLYSNNTVRLQLLRNFWDHENSSGKHAYIILTPLNATFVY